MSIAKLALVVVTSTFFHAARPAAYTQAPVSTRAPNWGGKSNGLSVILTFEQGADSIYGRGAYEVTGTNRIGCGGESLPQKGLFTMRAKGTKKSFKGRFLFDTGWSPPVTAVRNGNGDIKVSIRSVDKGVCPLTLRPTTAANPAIRRR